MFYPKIGVLNTCTNWKMIFVSRQKNVLMENGIYLCIYVCINDNENRKNTLKLYFLKNVHVT